MTKRKELIDTARNVVQDFGIMKKIFAFHAGKNQGVKMNQTCRSGHDCPNITTINKLKSKLKMMEISFELLTISRNDLIKQLAEQELLNEKLLEATK